MDRPPYPMRRHAPLPPLNAPRGSQIGAVSTASSVHRSSGDLSQASGGYRGLGASGSSAASSRPSSTSSFLHQDIQAQPFSSRSTSASSQCSGPDGNLAANAGELLNTLATSSPVDQQAELVVKAMIPIVKRAMVSKNQAVVKASLDSMRRIERMFGQECIDRHVETLAESLEKQSAKPGGDARATLILKTLTALCSEDAAAGLKNRFPDLAASQAVAVGA
eukprot:TRINITY_DN27807_c0_g1_i1.p1 TRINITY_DN27807_c0_g1~~TRINITY_DN27807_c0_g1_i1.p1  ORF type:complete len:221 (+),score=37.77 TRINITY_DN27807_c0_g1_i1:131-793(+)